jgi:hypothetical protein
MPEDTKEQRKDYVAGLLRERGGAVAREDDEHIAAIDAELKRMGHEAKAPAKRAESRPAADLHVDKRA